MWRRAAAAGLVLAAMVAVGVVGGGPAGAAPQLTLSPASGPPGTTFVITGTGFAALPVDMRWGGLSGPVIATAVGPAFSVTAVVPDSQPNSVPVMAVVGRVHCRRRLDRRLDDDHGGGCDGQLRPHRHPPSPGHARTRSHRSGRCCGTAGAR